MNRLISYFSGVSDSLLPVIHIDVRIHFRCQEYRFVNKTSLKQLNLAKTFAARQPPRLWQAVRPTVLQSPKMAASNHRPPWQPNFSAEPQKARWLRPGQWQERSAGPFSCSKLKKKKTQMQSKVVCTETRLDGRGQRRSKYLSDICYSCYTRWHFSTVQTGLESWFWGSILHHQHHNPEVALVNYVSRLINPLVKADKYFTNAALKENMKAVALLQMSVHILILTVRQMLCTSMPTDARSSIKHQQLCKLANFAMLTVLGS